MQKVVTNSNLNSPLKLFFFSPILTKKNLLLKIYCENIMVEFLNQDFLFFILFFILSFHSPPHTCPLSPFFYFFFSSKTFQQHHLLFSSAKRERQRQRERRKTRGSMFTMPSEIEVHHALPRPPSHRCSSSSPPSSWIRSACSLLFFFFLFFFFFSYLLVLIQLYFIRIGICFVFYVWIM